MMRRASFIIAFLGISVLLIGLTLSPDNVESLEAVSLQQKVQTNGFVISERIFDGFRIWELDNGIGIICDCDEIYLEKTIQVTGVVEEYNDEKQIRALTVVVSD